MTKNCATCFKLFRVKHGNILNCSVKCFKLHGKKRQSTYDKQPSRRAKNREYKRDLRSIYPRYFTEKLKGETSNQFRLRVL